MKRRIFGMMALLIFSFVLAGCDKTTTEQLTVVPPVETTQTTTQTIMQTTTQEITTTTETTATTTETTTTTTTVELIAFDVSFESNGGTPVATIHVDNNSTITLPSNPVKDGYHFMGWFTDVACENEFVLTAAFSGDDLTLYALWETNTYTIHLHILDTITQIDFKYGEQITLPSIDVNEHVFTGFYFDSDFTQAYDLTTMPSEDTDVYANLVVNTYKIIFLDSNDDLIFEEYLPYDFDLTNYVLPVIPEVTGYVGIGYYPDVPNTMPNQELTFHANYNNIVYSVNYYLDGVLESTDNYYLGDTVVPITLTLDDYSIFDGWYLDDQKAQLFDEAVTVSQDLNLYGFDLIDYEPATYNLVSTIILGAMPSEYIIFEGFVSNVFNDGYILTDINFQNGYDFLVVYEENHNVEIGDKIKVCGMYTLDNNSVKITDLLTKEVLSSGHNVLSTPLNLTVEQIKNLDTVNPAIGTRITVTAFISKINDNYYLSLEDDQVLISVLDSKLSLIDTQVGNKITITLFYLSNDSTEGVIVGFDIDSSGIVFVSTTPDYSSIVSDVADFEDSITEEIWSSITLPSFGVNGSTFTNFQSSELSVFANTGGFLNIPSESMNVIFTYTVSKGTLTMEKTIAIFVPGLYEISVANTAMQYKDAAFDGVVYAIADNGFYMHDNGSYLYVEAIDNDEDFEFGDEIRVIVHVDGGFEFVSYELLSSGNALPTATVATMSEICFTDDFVQGEVVTVRGIVSVGNDNYGNVKVIIEGLMTGSKYIHMDSNDYELISLDGEYVELELVLHENGEAFFMGLTEDVEVITTAPTYQEYADELIIFYIYYSETYNNNFTNLETDVYMYSGSSISNGVTYTISWDSSNQDVITDSGVVTLVYGTMGYADLTLTITIENSYSISHIFKATVIDKWDATPLTIPQAQTFEDGDLVKVTGFITCIYEGKAYLSDGPYGDNNIYINYPIDSEYVVGDIIIVYGTLNTYSQYGNDRREIVGVSKYELIGHRTILDYDNFSTPQEIANPDTIGDYLNRIYWIGLTVSDTSRTDGYVEFNGYNDTKIIFNPDDYINYFDIMYSVDDTINLKFIAHELVNGDLLIINVEFPEPSNGSKAYSIYTLFDIPSTVSENIIFPTDFSEYWNISVVWSTNNEAVISSEGVVTRPANGEGDATVRIFAQIGVGISVYRIDMFVVTVPELDE